MEAFMTDLCALQAASKRERVPGNSQEGHRAPQG